MITDFQLNENRLDLTGQKGHYRLECLGPNIFHCIYTEREDFAKQSPLEIEKLPGYTLNVMEEEDLIRIEGGRICLTVSKKDEKFRWLERENGRVFLKESGKELTRIPVERYTLDGEEPVIRRVKTVDGERNFVLNLKRKTVREAYRAKLYFEFDEEEQIHGLGQGEEGIYNYRGTVQYLYQHNMRIPVPFLVSSRNYGILMDCGSLMVYNDDARGSYLYLDTVEQLDYYFICGDCLDEVIDGFRRLTGRAAMLPKWAFGYIQSKEAYETQEELLSIAQRYRKLQVPLDCVVQDWHTWEEDKWGNKLLDKERYPDISRMNQELHDIHVHSMISVWPNMNAGTENHQEFLEKGMLLYDYATYDAFNEEARKVYWKQLEQELFSGGFDSWWCDSTEPFSGPDWSGENQREPWERYCLVGEEHKKYLDPAQANLFAVAHAKGIYENQRAACSEKRVLNLTRSGSASSQRYGTVFWSGDICATWKTLRKQITEGLNICMSGMPYWTLDIGGFFTVKDCWQNRGCDCNTDPSPKWFWRGDYEEGIGDLGYRELYVRWLQYAVFLPMFRSHGTDTPREIWNFGEPGSLFYEAIRGAIELRYRLMPYIYSLAGKAALENYTMLRSLLFDFAADKQAAGMDDEFMLGNSLLVCPVTEPMYFDKNSQELSRSKSWRCYLPAGCGWYDFWSSSRFTGGQWIEVETNIDKIPLFVREGSVLPLEQGLQYACQEVETPLEIHIYPGADGHFRLYEDMGDGYGYEKGEYQWIGMQWTDNDRVLRISEAPIHFPQGMKDRTCRIVLPDGGECSFVYEGKAVEIAVEK